MLYGVEKRLYELLKELSDEYQLVGVKCEFEAEGSTFDDVVRVRDMCSKAGIEVHLKIGGAEAKRDVMDAVVLGVDGIIAPMVESPFAAYKFMKLVETIYPESVHKPSIAINIESKTAVAHMDGILEKLEGFLSQVTFGRTDLSGSYFDKNIVPDSDFVVGLVQEKAGMVKKKGMKVAMGGSISVRTVAKLKETKGFLDVVDKIETRKCILPAKSMLKEGALAKCLEFEKIYLVSLKERNDVFNKGNLERLLKLEQRVF